MTGDGPPRSLAGVLAVVLACCLVAGLLVPVPVAAGDNLTIFWLEPDDLEVESGDTVTLDLVVSSHGDYSGDGIDRLSATLAYDADVFTVTEVEHGPMLADGDPDAAVEGEAEVDDEAGTATVSQERNPAGDGAIATDRAATITLAVADDAPQVTETIEIGEASATLVSDYPQGTVERDADIHVDGGGETGAEDDADTDGVDDPDGVTLAEDRGDENSSDESSNETAADADESTDDGSATASAEDDADDTIPGFGVAAALVAIALLLARRNRR